MLGHRAGDTGGDTRTKYVNLTVRCDIDSVLVYALVFSAIFLCVILAVAFFFFLLVVFIEFC